MNPFSKFDMQKALALTRGGRMGEAMAALTSLAPAASKPRVDGAGMPLAELLRTALGRLGQVGSVPGSAPDVTSPVTGRPGRGPFEEHVFTNAAGSRSYKLFVPSGAARQEALPLLVMLHGCTQSPDDFAAGTRMNVLAEERNVLVVYPAQAQSANASRCWNWFSEADQQRDLGEPSLIAGITRAVQRDHGVDPARIFVAGLSAGGAAAAVMGATYPELYAGVGVHSGLPCGAARDLTSALMAMRGSAPLAMPRPTDPSAGAAVPTIVIHGDRDATVSPVNGDRIIARSAQGLTLRAAVSHGQSPGGVAYTRTVHADPAGSPLLEQWVLHGAGHAWSGGSPAGSFTDPRGPDASAAMMDFFLGLKVGERGAA